MKTIKTKWLFVLLVLMASVAVWAAVDAPDQSARTLVKSYAQNVAGTQTQNNYGILGLVSTSTVTVEAVNRSAGGSEYTFALSTGLLADIWTDTGLTSVWTSEPISGTGVAGNAVTIAGDKGDVTVTTGTVAIDDDAVDDTDIDFGTGAGQVDTDNVPEGSTNKWNIMQNLWETIAADTGSRGAPSATATLTVTGGTGISTAMLIDTLTITNDNPFTIGGSDSQMQYNNGGVLGGEADFVWEDTNNQLLLGNPVAIGASIQLIGDGMASFVGSVYSGDEVHVGWSGIGVVENEGELWLYDGDDEALGVRAINIAANTELDLSAIGAWTDDYLVAIDTSPASGPAFVAINPASITPDTNTDMEVICIGDATSTVVGLSVIDIGYPSCIPYTGTATYVGVYVSVWSTITGSDTVTVTLYVDGVSKDSWTMTAASLLPSGSAPGSFGGAVSEALTQGHYISVKAQVTIQSGGLDLINIQSAICNVIVL